MNELQNPKLKGKPRSGIEEDSSFEPGSAPSDIIKVGNTVGVSAQEGKDKMKLERAEFILDFGIIINSIMYQDFHVDKYFFKILTKI